MLAGWRWAARTKGSVVEAKEERERGRKEEKLVRGGECARNDSRPEEKAKEPTGRAESERSRRKWFAEVDGARGTLLVIFFLSFYRFRR